MSQERIFAGVTVIDITRNLAGPLCSLMLGDLGAEIIKIESPTGDDDRRAVTFEGRRPEDEDLFYGVNRNKKSVAVNLRDPEGRDLVLALSAQADVFLQNYGPGTLERRGLGYEAVRRVNPSILYCSISGFGQSGPFRDRKAYDPIVQAMAGVLFQTRKGDGPPGSTGLAAADTAASFHAAYAIAAALYARQRTGKGQFIDIAMFDSLLPMMAQGLREYLATGRLARRPLRVPMGAYQCKDGEYIYVIAAQPDWAAFCKAMGNADLARDPLFRTNNDRRENREALEDIFHDLFSSRTASEWDAVLTEAGVPCGLVNRPDQVLTGEQVKARGMVREVQHPVSGPIKLIGWPYHLSETPAEIFLPPPLLGQHTAAVLQERLGTGAEGIQRLQQRKVILCAGQPAPAPDNQVDQGAAP